ncbi:MAG: thiol-disulfide isomerase/thioredoxin [Kiritimatiellia bacterium]|jgi:thiol-disulfide isomerase/thioredoxin
MMLWLVQVALASTLTVTGASVEVQRGSFPDGTPEPLVESTESGTLASFPGGWVVVRGANVPLTLYLEPEWTSVVSKDGHIKGGGAAALQLLVDVAARTESPPSNLSEAGRASDSLRRWIARSDVDDDAKQRAIDLAHARIMDGLVRTTAPRKIYEDADWLNDVIKAVKPSQSVTRVPEFRQFMWAFGRFSGGVTSQGAAKAMHQTARRAAALGRHEAMHGTIYWAVESADTRAELTALDDAMAAWSEYDPPPLLIGYWRAKVILKQSVGPGQPAPRFEAKGLDGELVASKTLLGKPVVLDFWGTWCAPCIAAIPRLKALSMSRPGVRFVSVASEEAGLPRWRAMIRKYNWDAGWTHLYVDGNRVAKQFGVVKYPTTVVIDADGDIVRVGVSDSELTAVLDELTR